MKYISVVRFSDQDRNVSWKEYFNLNEIISIRAHMKTGGIPYRYGYDLYLSDQTKFWITDIEYEKLIEILEKENMK